MASFNDNYDYILFDLDGTLVDSPKKKFLLYNTLGLFAASIIYSLKPESKKIYISLWLIIIGMSIFSFSLYFLAILSMPILGAITPIGGTLLIIAWLSLAYGVLKD